MQAIFSTTNYNTVRSWVQWSLRHSNCSWSGLFLVIRRLFCIVYQREVVEYDVSWVGGLAGDICSSFSEVHARNRRQMFFWRQMFRMDCLQSVQFFFHFNNNNIMLFQCCIYLWQYFYMVYSILNMFLFYIIWSNGKIEL